MTELNDKPANASDLIQFHLYAIKDYETQFLNAHQAVRETYRYIGLYRLLGNPIVLTTTCTWMAQAVIEAEIRRDNVNINTSEQLDEYYDNFVTKMAAVNTGYKENLNIQRIIELAFNNIYDLKGFNDEAD